MKSWDNLLERRNALGSEWTSDTEREEFRQAFESHLARFRGAQ